MAKLFLFLALCCLAIVYAQDTRDLCPTAERLFKEGCARGCIEVTRESFPCPMCLAACNGISDECNPDEASSCADTSDICQAVGTGGRYECDPRPAEGENCEFIQRTRQESDADIANQLSNTVILCRDGLVCRRETLETSVCRVEAGPCPSARATSDSALDCDEDGNFESRQCRRITNSRLYQCRCVNPTTGIIIRDTTEVEVSDPNTDGPDCDDIVHERCRFPGFEVRSGDKFINPTNCSRCLCRDGQSVLCERLRDGACEEFNPTEGPTRDCDVRGRTLPNGNSIRLGCNRCACKSGVLVCTRRGCESDEEDEDESDPVDVRNCRVCGTMRASPVCGDDGQTYPSRCHAVSCRGLESSDLTTGPCSRRDVCQENPCADNEVCLSNAGVTCLSRAGCLPERQRRCVDLAQLRCKRRQEDDADERPTNATADGDSDSSRGDDDDDDDDDEAVCGSDGRTYSSVCNLIQNSVQIRVDYTGRCNRTECTGGMVCGTDGMTYDNICELQLNSANARVDYRGACEPEESDEVINVRCLRLRRSGRCANLTACRTDSRVRPGDGCCPICGGAVTIGLDRDAFDAYVRLNPDFDTVDEFLNELIVSRFIPEDVVRRCKVAASILWTGDMHLVLEVKSNSDGLCAMAIEEIAKRINTPPTSDGTATTTSVNPQILQFAIVAETSPLVDESGNLPTSSDGAVPVVSFSLAMMLVPIMVALFM